MPAYNLEPIQQGQQCSRQVSETTGIQISHIRYNHSKVYH